MYQQIYIYTYSKFLYKKVKTHILWFKIGWSSIFTAGYIGYSVDGRDVAFYQGKQLELLGVYAPEFS